MSRVANILFSLSVALALLGAVAATPLVRLRSALACFSRLPRSLFAPTSSSFYLVALFLFFRLLFDLQDDYVNMPDPTYKWHLAGQISRNGFTAYFINMTSQTWLTAADSSQPVWFHWLTVCIPDQVRCTRNALNLGLC